MEKLNKTIVYSVAGFCGGAVTLASASGPCSSGDCSTCFRCFVMGLVLASLALAKRVRKGTTDGPQRNEK